jgi:hypothetical protein
MDWANDAVYLSIFVFGYVFASDYRIQNKIREYFKPAIFFTAVSLSLLFYVNIKFEEMNYSFNLVLLWAAAKGFYECFAIILLICICSKYLNNGGKRIKHLSDASFTIYIFNFLPVTFFTFIFSFLKINIYLKFILVVILSYISVFLIHEIILKAKSLKPKPLNTI